MKPYALVLIEWEDSAQPVSGWRYLSDFSDFGAVLCVSVGWLIHDGEDVKALAPNLGEKEDAQHVQVSGVIRIPTRSVVRIQCLDEATSSCRQMNEFRQSSSMGQRAFDLAPELGPSRQASESVVS